MSHPKRARRPFTATLALGAGVAFATLVGVMAAAPGRAATPPADASTTVTALAGTGRSGEPRVVQHTPVVSHARTRAS